jgi:catechol 2,3-dioxygenase-like lactoylglutathione lyase family enzyme
MPSITRISGITLRVMSMVRSVRFYRDILSLRLLYGDESSSFCSFDVDGTYLNLELSDYADAEWGRVIFYCDDVNQMHEHLKSKGYLLPLPRDAPWGERFFHVKDPDGHELSLAQRYS